MIVLTLLYTVAGGMLATLATGRIDQIAWRFLRAVGVLSFALFCVATVWSFRTEGLFTSSALRWWTMIGGVAAGCGAASLLIMAPAATNLPKVFQTTCAFAGLLGMAAACLSALDANGAGDVLASVMVVVSQGLGALLLGSITVAWLLGHAYLTATRMTIAPLRHFSRMLSWSVAVRIAFLVLSLLIAWRTGAGASPGVLARLADSWLIGTLRIGVGLVAVAVFAYMVADCVRLRSTQSATGILYFGSVMAYIGELAGQQLNVELGWPI